MNIYSNVTQEDLFNLRKLAEQQKYQRALKNKNRILKQTYDKKLVESLSHITKKPDEVKEYTQILGETVKGSNTPRITLEKTHNALPIVIEQIHSGVKYDPSLEKTLNNMKNNTGFFIEERDNGDIIWNGFPVEKNGGIRLKIKEKIYDITPGIQKVLTDTSNIPMKKLNEKDREILNNILESLDFENYKAKRGKSKSDRYKQSKTNFKKRVNKSKLEGQGIEQILISSNIIDIYTRLEILLELKLSGHTDTLTEASNLVDELYKRGDLQNGHQYRNATNEISTF